MQEPINNQSMLRVGTVLRGIYRIDSYLSSGGFGNTYVATNIEFEERVAIKEFFMKGVTQRDDNQTTVSVSNTENHNSFLEQREKFKKEARRLRQLNNPHIVRVHDLFEENGTAYYVMDFVDGENLSDRLKRTGKPLTETEVNEILPQVLDALKTVHDAGIWHLDLKPANIMVDKSGNVKLIDFGASKQLNAQKGGATTSTAISYTNGYAPREQMEQNYDKFGPWTDLYALGATLYNLLTNKRPPLPTDIDDDMSEDKHLALPMPNVNDSMKKLILWLMQTNRMKRPKAVEEVFEELRHWERKSNSHKVDEEETILENKEEGKETTMVLTPIDESKSYTQKRTESETQKIEFNHTTTKSVKLWSVIALIFISLILYVTVWMPNKNIQSDLPQETDEITAAQQLKDRLNKIRKKGIMFGHQDDPLYGLSWEFDNNRSDVKSVCGDYPSIMGFDLGGIEVNDACNLDGVPFDRLAVEVIKHHIRGGIVTLSWHPRNPVTTLEEMGVTRQEWPKGTVWDVSDNTAVKKILPEGKYHEKFATWMQRLSNFLSRLKDDNGNPIPIIFRPWHENSGSWFWWGEKLCTVEEYKALWNMLQDKLTADGFDNLVWAYSPSMAQNLTEEKFIERYPGNNRVDIIGIDGYQWGTKEEYQSQLDQNLRMISAFAEKNQKIPALTECGLKNVTTPDWWTSVLLPIVEKYPISYMLVWRNAKHEWFGPSPTNADKDDFKSFYKKENTLFLKDIDM